MNEEENFLTIEALSALIHRKVKYIQKGDLKIQKLEQLLDEVKDLQERLIIIKYKAMEKVAKKPVEKNLFSAENFGPNTSDEKKETTEIGLDKNEISDIAENQISLIDSIEEVSKEEKTKKRDPVNLKFEKNASAKVNIVEEQKEILFEEMIVQEAPVSSPPIQEKEKSSAHEKPKKKKAAVNKKKTTLSQKIRKTQIDSIAKSIKLNQRIGMIKKLFGGDDQRFKKEIQTLNDATSLEQAQSHLSQLKVSGSWKEEDPLFILLTQLVERRHV